MRSDQPRSNEAFHGGLGQPVIEDDTHEVSLPDKQPAVAHHAGATAIEHALDDQNTQWVAEGMPQTD